MGIPPDLTSIVWRKSSHSGANGGNCIEVADGFATVVPVRDSKDPGGPALLFTPDAFTAFVTAIKDNRFPTTEQA
ncbi:DUF397 domain-containing protein [Allostreptomyces psammosilenae]|uniref:DUF397 domain-containing protein n=1 Tax=Allostreptomyces psammosilenae TaxID=1892865 RepID=A0A853A5N2_9ACTN|nr:DUF397 domain-containing protein [Allostreptomyces psammosilenae]NYI05802.1 hypothetical protein [Allostreptomyces psammosilenae]